MKPPYKRQPIKFKKYPLPIELARAVRQRDNKIKSLIDFMLMQSVSNMSAANKETLRQIKGML